MALTGKTIGQLTFLESPTADTLIPAELSGETYHIAFSGISSYTEITYDELYSSYTGATLTPGKFYLITDFQSIYDQPDFDQNGLEILGSYKIGDIEPLVVLATSGNTLAPQAYSPTYPKDKITYDITFTQTERNSQSAKGRITERIDDRNNRADYDLRAIIFRRYNMYYSDQIYKGKIDITTDGIVTGYDTNFTGDFSVDDVFGVYLGAYQEPIGCFKYFKILTVDSNSGMTVTGKTMINESNVYYSKGRQYFQKISPFQTNIVDDLDYSEYKTFPAGVNAYNVYIGDYANYFEEEGNSFLLSNNVFLDGTHQMITLGDLSANNSFDDDLNSLVFGTDTYNNIITNDFDRNSLGNNFSNNIIMCDMRDNFIQNYFQYNMLGDNDGYDFDSNTIGNNFLANFTSFYNDGFQNNIIGDNFRNNIIDDGFYRNQIGYNFYDNLIFRDFTDNNTSSDFNTNNIYGEFVNNIVGVNFTNNTIGDINDFYNYVFNDNQIGNGFNYNIMFSDFYKNQVGNNFYNNDISGQTTNNVIGNQFENNTIYNNFQNNKLSDDFKGNMMLQSFEGNNVDSFISGNQFSGNAYNNNIGAYTFDNDFLGAVSSNNWGDAFYGNTIGYDFINNSICSNFYSNTIGSGFQYNTIGHDFNNNDIGDNFGYGYSSPQGNKIGNAFYGNFIGEYFYNNTISDNFFNITVGNLFQWNNVNTSINGVGLYSCVLYSSTTVNLFTNNGGDTKLSYFDDMDILNVESINETTCVSFTITSSDFTNGGEFYQNTTALGVNGVDGFENTAPENWLGEGYYGQGLSGTSLSQLTTAYNLLGFALGNTTGYLWNVTWGPGSSIPSGVVKFGANVNNGYFNIQAIDTSDTDYLIPNNNNGTSLVGTFYFPATFTIYLPLTNKSGWC